MRNNDIKEFIENMQRDLISDSFETRSAANLALLAYDLGRAKTEVEEANARKEYDFRMFAFISQGGLSWACHMGRRVNR